MSTAVIRDRMMSTSPAQVELFDLIRTERTQLGPTKERFTRAFLSVQPPLLEVEAAIRRKFESDAALLGTISEYLHAQGGKRIRPALCLLAASLFGKHLTEREHGTLDESAELRRQVAFQQTAFPRAALSQQVIDVSAGIELIHMATLLHDDIIDEAPKRRHETSAYRRFGLGPSLLAGDFLLVRAFGLCAHLDDFVVTETERACVELTEGEILETKLSITDHKNLEYYITIVGKKTASLFTLATKVGSYLAGASDEDVKHLAEYGYNAGIAFQIVDDILDITGDEELLGKPAGTDLRQHAPSLVNILWLQSGDGHAGRFFSQAKPTADKIKQALVRLKNSPVIDECRTLARKFAAKANAELHAVSSPIVDAEVRGHLTAILEYTLERCL